MVPLSMTISYVDLRGASDGPPEREPPLVVDSNAVQVLEFSLDGRSSRMRRPRQAELGRATRSTEDMISHLEALVLARSGRLQDARRTSAAAIDIAKEAGRRERAALFESATAVWEAFYGNTAEARQRVQGALGLARGRDVDYAAALALALSGDATRSRALADELAKNLPEDTSVQYMYLPTLRALYSLNARDAAAAIPSLETASRYDLAVGGVGFKFFGAYPVYVRGEAYLEAHRPAEAAAELQRIEEARAEYARLRKRGGCPRTHPMADSLQDRSGVSFRSSRPSRPTASAHCSPGYSEYTVLPRSRPSSCAR
jgi:hypothetical protein